MACSFQLLILGVFAMQSSVRAFVRVKVGRRDLPLSGAEGSASPVCEVSWAHGAAVGPSPDSRLAAEPGRSLSGES